MLFDALSCSQVVIMTMVTVHADNELDRYAREHTAVPGEGGAEAVGASGTDGPAAEGEGKPTTAADDEFTRVDVNPLQLEPGLRRLLHRTKQELLDESACVVEEWLAVEGLGSDDEASVGEAEQGVEVVRQAWMAETRGRDGTGVETWRPRYRQLIVAADRCVVRPSRGLLSRRADAARARAHARRTLAGSGTCGRTARWGSWTSSARRWR